MLCGLPKMRMPRRLVRLFKKKANVGPAHQALERGEISGPHELRRIDSKGHPINSKDVPIAGSIFPLDTVGGGTPSIATDLATPADLYGQVIPITDDAVTKVEATAEAEAEAKKDNPGDVAGPAPKDI